MTGRIWRDDGVSHFGGGYDTKIIQLDFVSCSAPAAIRVPKSGHYFRRFCQGVPLTRFSCCLESSNCTVSFINIRSVAHSTRSRATVTKQQHYHKMEFSRFESALIVIAMLIAPPVNFVFRAYMSARKYLQDRELIDAPWTNPLRPPRLRRRLTAPLPPPEPHLVDLNALAIWRRRRAQETSAQEQCGFLSRLSPDVRYLIYQEVVGGNTFHLSSSTNNGPPRKFRCIRPWQFMDAVHGDCHGTQEPLRLLALPMTCRMVYTEMLPVLYTTNALDFTQSFCFFNFMSALPRQHHKHLRRLRYFYIVNDDIVQHQVRAFRDWTNFCRFMATNFDPRLELLLDAHPDGKAATKIRRAVNSKQMQWLDPLLRLSENVRLKLIVPSGDSGAFRAGQSPTRESMSTVIDFDAVKQGVTSSDHEAILDVVLKQMQEALWNWRPYGKLIGEP